VCVCVCVCVCVMKGYPVVCVLCCKLWTHEYIDRTAGLFVVGLFVCFYSDMAAGGHRKVAHSLLSLAHLDLLAVVLLLGLGWVIQIG
jgi:predicted acyltransferase